MGVTGLQSWVQESASLTEFYERRAMAEDVVAVRYCAGAALLFVKLCDERPAAARQLRSARVANENVLALARVWAREIRTAWLAGNPCPILPAPSERYTLELAHSMALGGEP